MKQPSLSTTTIYIHIQCDNLLGCLHQHIYIVGNIERGKNHHGEVLQWCQKKGKKNSAEKQKYLWGQKPSSRI